MNSIWEYIVPTTIMAIICAYTAHRKGKNPLLWFAVGMLFNFLAIIIIAGTPDSNRKEQKSKLFGSSSVEVPDKRPGTLTAAAVLIFVQAGIVGFLGLLQLVFIEEGTLFYAIYNIATMAICIISGVRIIKMDSSVFKMVLFFTIINTIYGLVQLTGDAAIYFLIITPVCIATLVLLLLNWSVMRR
ncbi:hypothetical protein PAECIP111893_02148 [Paenibacillus plantiphilus]|uniref:Uncharacterized protein n=1 Tax=Paenibacillus plantiphilus TaxID=2905650 RepID=A0ABM9C4N2_9BACL|nr:hypothetical protein [Paenibacillus plantiphilus]CAH1204124.1 hypothetical protein PAECIP111893_02148 [Paenibacillus plantiphilus]